MTDLSPLEKEPDSFERWYDAYPKKVAPGRAEKAYKTALKITDPETLQRASEAQAVIWDERTGYQSKHGPERVQALEFLPNPATWLNGKSWRNEYIQEYLSKPKQGNIVIKQGEPGWNEWLKHDPTLKTYGGKIVVPTLLPPQEDT